MSKQPGGCLDSRLWERCTEQRRLQRSDWPWRVSLATRSISRIARAALTTTGDALPHWLNTGDSAWQMTAATFVGLMSIPGMVVLYGGILHRRWSVPAMKLVLGTFAAVSLVWVLYAFKMGFGHP